MKFKINDRKNLSSSEIQVKLLAHALGNLFQAEEVEIEQIGMEEVYPSIFIKTHDLGLSEIDLLRHLAEYFYLSIDSETESEDIIEIDEKGTKAKHIITRVVIELIPLDYLWKKITEKIN